MVRDTTTCPRDGLRWHISSIILPKMHNLSLTMRKHRTYIEGLPIKHLSTTVKNCEGHERQEKTKEVSLMGEMKM